MGGLFGTGVQMLIDGQQNYVRGGLTAWLRLQNFQASGDYQEFGVAFAPTGQPEETLGFTDILIQPPPSVTDVSAHDIGNSGGKLMFGAKRFLVSNTFVQDMRQKYPNVIDPYDIWRNWDNKTPVIGIIYNNRMHSIEEILTRELGGQTISWILMCNADENYIPSPANQQDEP